MTKTVTIPVATYNNILQLLTQLQSTLAPVTPSLQKRPTVSHRPPNSTVRCFPDELRAKRLAQGWTQSKLAERIGVNTLTIRNWELGRTDPKRNSSGRIRAGGPTYWEIQVRLDRHLGKFTHRIG